MPEDKKTTKSVKVGPFSASLNQLQSGVHAGKWKITYKDRSGVLLIGGVFKSLAKAKKRADDLLHQLLDDSIDPTDDEIRVIKAMRSASVSADDVVSLINDLNGTESITASEAANQFYDREVEGSGYSYEQRKDYRRVLDELGSKFPAVPLSTISLSALESWSDSWNVGAKRHNNKRSILISFWQWAEARRFARSNVAQSLQRKRLPTKSAHDVLTPKEFAKLLVNCPNSHLPWLALSGFAGLRGVEIYGRPDDRNTGLKWEDIDWEKGVIILDRSQVKQTKKPRARKIEMGAALIDWLSPWKSSKGPVYSPEISPPNSGHSPMTATLGKFIGGWKNNVLRASRASYRLAETQSIATVTLEMGHTQDILLGTYLNPRFEEDAKIWFSLDRSTAGILSKS